MKIVNEDIKANSVSIETDGKLFITKTHPYDTEERVKNSRTTNNIRFFKSVSFNCSCKDFIDSMQIEIVAKNNSG